MNFLITGIAVLVVGVLLLLVWRHGERSRLASERQRFDEQQRRFDEQQQLMEARFKNLAHDIFDTHTQRFKETNKETLDVLLKPFKDNITEFRERVERIHSSQNEQQGALRNELKNLMDLNRRITTETTNLTNALKGNNKTQGDWGEIILESILDNSNLVKGVHYDTQSNLKDDAGNNLRPDVVLFLPDGKRIVIDSKVSLTAYTEYTSTQDSQHLKSHVASVRTHMVELGRKEYHRLLESPDFVIMFIPNEPAFLEAMRADMDIWQDAYERKVIISSPTNLIPLLKMVNDLWRRDEQKKNSVAILENATKLYEQLVSFTTSLEGVGQALNTAQAKYDEAYTRLTKEKGNGSIILLGERLRALGLNPTKLQSAKTLNEIEE